MFAMSTVLTIVVIAFVVLVLAVVVYALFELSPFASHHGEKFHEPGRPQPSPRLD
jgi:hypothetical protein